MADQTIYTFSEEGFRQLRADHEKLMRLVLDLSQKVQSTHKFLPAKNMLLGKLSSQLNWGSSADMVVWSGTAGDESETNKTITVWDWLLNGSGEHIASGKKVIAAKFQHGWYVIAAECP